MKAKLAIILTLYLGIVISANGQEVKDTLAPSISWAYRYGLVQPGTRIVKPDEIIGMVTATGAPDVIKLIQTLPGVSTGGEGSSAYYVRGGNLGDNLITLDGVPLFGGTHLLGMTSAYSPKIVSETLFQIGGFSSDEGNLSASHIKLTTKDGNFSKKEVSFSASNFLLDGFTNIPLIENKLSFVGSVRMSPLQWEYSGIKNIFHNSTDSISNLRVLVYDVFGKLDYRINDKSKISLSIFNSRDRYRYVYNSSSDEDLRWENLILNLRHIARTDNRWEFRSGLSYNHSYNQQKKDSKTEDALDHLMILSRVNETTFQSMVLKPFGYYSCFQAGIKSRWAEFNPGSSKVIEGGSLHLPSFPLKTHYSSSFINTAHAQLEINGNILNIRVAGKINNYRVKGAGTSGWYHRTDPEFSALLRINLCKWLAIEGTGDLTTQYYHTLEGVPVGWSLDMMIPADGDKLPEKCEQVYAGVLTKFGNHHISAGSYYKEMTNLVFFKQASALFSSALSYWEDLISVGTGTSHGYEFLYEKSGKRLTGRLAYTWSNTDRSFPVIDNQKKFPAKFDRRHILNCNLSYVIFRNEKKEFGASTLFTYQSGHWETVPAGWFETMLLYDEIYNVDYFAKEFNNYRMPSYVRWDIGGYFSIKGKKLSHRINLGVYNVLNRHNPFALTYNVEKREWRSISLLPIMPSFSYTVEF